MGIKPPTIVQRMRDGTMATLRRNGDYFVRNDEFNFTSYYSLDGDPIPMASAVCLHCKDLIISTRPGDERTCLCGKISVVTDKNEPMRHFYRGFEKDMEIIS